MTSLANKVFAITGAGSGIGRALALQLAAEGVHLAISDIDQKGLDETMAALDQYAIKKQAKILDVADREAVYQWADEVQAFFGYVNGIINNAGVALAANIDQMEYEDFEWLFNINFWGVVYGTKAFLPHLKAAKSGHIVNVSSVFGLISVPSQAAYNSAKFAVRGFTEALRQELELDGYDIGCTCIHPGGIRTNIVHNAKFPGRVNATATNDAIATKETTEANESSDIADNSKTQMENDFENAAMTSAEQAADQIISAMRSNKRRKLVGWDAVLIDLVQRLMPTFYQKLITANIKRNRSRARTVSTNHA